MSTSLKVKRILVTGGAGFLGSHLVRHFVQKYPAYRIVNFDGGPNGARLVGQMVDVRITQALPHSLRGEVLTHETA